MVKTMSLPKRAVALFSAAIIAVSMMCAMPLSAMAAGDVPEASGYQGTIQATNRDATVAIGDTLNMSVNAEVKYFNIKNVNDDTLGHHVDYSVVAGTGTATINKHSGILTPQTEGTVTVTARLLDCAQPSQVSSNPCYQERVISTAAKTVTITEAQTGDYGWQGNALQIKMSSFDPQVNAGASDPDNDIYVNTLTGVVAENGYYSFGYSQSFGTGSNFEAYVERNWDNITLYRGQGQNKQLVASLGDGVLDLSGQAQSNDLAVQVPASALSAGNYTLTFEPTYQSNNGRMLDATISFTFSIS